MIPSIDLLTQEIEEEKYYDETYRIVAEYKGEEVPSRISGRIDELESIKQAIYLILHTERYAHLIYSWDYGIELIDLFGKPMAYVMSELPRRIEEALKVDDRIKSVTNFEFDRKGKALHTTFTVVTTVGNIDSELEVEI